MGIGWERFLTSLELKLKFVDSIGKDGCRQLPRFLIAVGDSSCAKWVTLTCGDGGHCLVKLEFDGTDHDIKVASRWPACFRQGKVTSVYGSDGSTLSVLRYEPKARLVERFSVQCDGTAYRKLRLSRF